MLERFHFTPVSTWPVIAREGIVPYQLKSGHVQKFSEVGVNTLFGIYVWPEVDDELLSDFLMFKRATTGASSGLLLRCEIPIGDIAGGIGYNEQKPLDRVQFWHDLNLNTDGAGRQQHHVKMDICGAVIPPERITTVKKIEIAVSSVTAGLDVLIA